MANLESLIKQLNAKVLTDVKKSTRLCNCIYICILFNNALYTKQKLLQLTNVNSTMEHQMESSKLYYGKSDGEFKTRFNNQARPFRY